MPEQGGAFGYGNPNHHCSGHRIELFLALLGFLVVFRAGTGTRQLRSLSVRRELGVKTPSFAIPELLPLAPT